jgi:hypothetical protein
MNEQQLVAVKQAMEALKEVAARTGPRWALEQGYAGHLEAITALQSIISQDALDKKAENARELGLSYDDEPKIGCVNHDCDQCKAVQEPEYWNVVDPAGNIVASETDAIRGWARIAGSYKPTVEGLLGFHDQGWRVLPKVTSPAPQPVPVKTYHDGKPWPVAPAPDPVPIIQQLVTALEGSGTKMRSDQWYIEIEAVAAGKFYLNSKGKSL